MEPHVSTAPGSLEPLVLDVIRGLVSEADGGHARRPISPEVSLTRDLGLGSLERVELMMRLEQASGLELPETLLAEADTPRAISRCLDAVLSSGSSRPPPTARRQPAPPRAAPSAGRTAPSSTRTLVEVLRWHAEATPDRVHIHLREDAQREQAVTYGALWQDAVSVAAGLRDRGVGPGERVALLLRTELAFFHAYFGILLAGAVPVPLYPPFRADQIEDYARRQAGILQNASARLLLTFAQAERAAGLLRPLVPSLEHVVTVDQVRSDRGVSTFPSIDASQLALIQYTSGSTGVPKGVALSHANLLANVRAFGEAFEITPDDVGVSWLPLYHDMGLIGAWFGALYHGTPVVIMSPLTFLAKPVRWLEAFHQHRGTLAAAPNFAYDLCVRKIPDAELEGLDLGSWRCALNGAEAVMAGTIERFATRFATRGFRREAMKPVYGLAEASLCLTAPPPGRPPRVDRLAREPFERRRAVEPAAAHDLHPLTFVACGRALAGHAIRCVDDREMLVDDRIEGHVQFRGPSAMQGYFENAEATRAVLREDGWIDTGDLGYQADGDLFITGRTKDVIIAGGRNISPQEVEEAVGEVAGIRRGCVAAFGVAHADTGTERLVIVAESRERDAALVRALEAGIVARVVDAIGMPPDAVVIGAPGTVLKTSSGKIRRAATRDLYTAGRLRVGRASTWLQWARLVSADLGWRLRRAVATAGVLIYSLLVWTTIAVLVPPLWIAVALQRTPHGARRTIGAFARLFLRIAGCQPTVAGRGVREIEAARPAVIVANHASFLDVVLLLAILPVPVRFAAKARLASYPVLGTILRRAGYVHVERGSTTAATALSASLDEESLFIFPEGTFMKAPGVMPFRLGAFQAAVERARPVVPIALRGTRDAWPDGTFRLRRRPLSVTIGLARWPAAVGWAETVRLREEARQWIADQAGEALVDRGLMHVDASGRVEALHQ